MNIHGYKNKDKNVTRMLVEAYKARDELNERYKNINSKIERLELTKRNIKARIKEMRESKK